MTKDILWDGNRISETVSKEEFVKIGLENPKFVDLLLSKLRQQSVRDHRFDFNYSLAEGKTGEKLVDSILSDGGKVEVKLDNRVSDTGNVVVEYAHSGKPSGITTTEADYYAFVLGGDKFKNEVIVFVQTDRLRKIINNCSHQNKASGAPGNSDFVLVPVESLTSTGCVDTTSAIKE